MFESNPRNELVVEFGKRYNDIVHLDNLYQLAKVGSDERQQCKANTSAALNDMLDWLMDACPMSQEYRDSFTDGHLKQCFALAHNDIFMQSLFVIDQPLIPLVVMRHFICIMNISMNTAAMPAFVRFAKTYINVVCR